MKRIPQLISKTKLMRGFRCLKCIYLTIHNPELEPPVTPDLQAVFDQGNIVGVAAREFMPGGKLVDCKPWEFGAALSITRDLIADGTPIIYEAAFEYMGCYARADIIQYNPDSKRWNIYEVKSTLSVKEEHLQDVGLQTWIMAKSGLPIEKIHVMHLNRECRYPDLSNLFVTVDVTQQMRDNYPLVKPAIAEILDTIRRNQVPAVDIGPQCYEPTECPFTAHCWQHIPDTSIFNLPKIGERKWELYEDDIINLDDDRLIDLNELQQRMVDCYRTGTRYINHEGLRAAISDWQYPLVFLDFESINPAIPRYHGTTPYQQVPFQFSVHVQATENAPLQHFAFLETTAADPRPALIPALLAACGTEGSIVAYFSKFEKDRIKELAEFAPEFSDALLALNERVVDPLPVIRDNVYDNAFNGSFSLKYVAPALLGEAQSYAGMDVANGGDAQRAFSEIIASATPPARKASLEQALLEYCAKDTQVMVDLTAWIKNQATVQL